MNLKQKKIVGTAAVICLLLGIAPVSNAMHIMEGYLPGKFWPILPATRARHSRPFARW